MNEQQNLDTSSNDKQRRRRRRRKIYEFNGIKIYADYDTLNRLKRLVESWKSLLQRAFSRHLEEIEEYGDGKIDYCIIDLVQVYKLKLEAAKNKKILGLHMKSW